MALTVDHIHEILLPLISKAQSLYPNIEFYPVIYSHSEPKKAAQKLIQKIRKKPYEKAFRIILQREFNAKYSDFLGLSIYKRKTWLGLKETEVYQCVFSIKANTINDPLNAEYIFWHMFSHALDNIKLRNNPKFKDSFLEGPMIPKRPLPNKALSNLKADILATLVVSSVAPKHIVSDLIKKACQHPLNKHSSNRASLYPLPLAIEHIYFALETVSAATNIKSVITLAKGLSEDIISAFDKTTLQNWFKFVENAQEMAWQGFTPQDILSAAVNTSESASIRNLAGEIAGILEITPSRNYEIDKYYNPFLSSAVNSRNHFVVCREIFQKLLAGAVAERSANRFYEEAMRQNLELLEGNGFGWCAYPLLEAARYMEQKKVFLGQSANTQENTEKWQDELTDIYENSIKMLRYRDIYAFSSQILSYRIDNQTVSYDDLHKNALQNPDYNYIAQSLEDINKRKIDAYKDVTLFKASLSRQASAQFDKRHSKTDIEKRKTSLEKTAESHIKIKENKT